MSIAVPRLKRAIEAVPIGGMQTGSPKVQLKLADAYRAIAEIENLIVYVNNLEEAIKSALHGTLLDEQGNRDEDGLLKYGTKEQVAERLQTALSKHTKGNT
jgi:hypothetical protein